MIVEERRVGFGDSGSNQFLWRRSPPPLPGCAGGPRKRAALRRVGRLRPAADRDSLRARFGPLWMEPDAKVRMGRHVRFGDALRERYAFGRLFGCTRLQFVGTGRRWYYTCLAPALPILLFGRMAWAALPNRRLRKSFVRSIPCLTAMVLAWSWGEWLGYLTRRRPGALTTAPEIDG